MKVAERVGNGGDPYMYTDFTGATLYLNNSLSEFDLKKFGAWDDKSPLKKIGFSWLNKTGTSEDWKEIKVELRCYSDEANRGEYQVVEIAAKPKDIQYLNVASCQDKVVSRADLRLTQIGASSTLMAIDKVQLTAWQ